MHISGICIDSEESPKLSFAIILSALLVPVMDLEDLIIFGATTFISELLADELNRMCVIHSTVFEGIDLIYDLDVVEYILEIHREDLDLGFEWISRILGSSAFHEGLKPNHGIVRILRVRGLAVPSH